MFKILNDERSGPRAGFVRCVAAARALALWGEIVVMMAMFSLVPISVGLWHPARTPSPHDGARPIAALKSGDSVSTVCFSPDSRSLATASLSGVVRVLDLGSRESRTIITPRLDQLQPALRFLGDGRLVILPQNAKFWELWNAEGLDEVGTVDFRKCRILNGSIGNRLLAGTQRDSFSICVRDRRTGVEMARFSGHQSPLSALAFAPDETILASGDTSGWLKLWDLSTGTERASVRVHASPVCDLAFSPDGALLGTVNTSDPTIRLWDGRTGAPRGAISVSHSNSQALAFHPDGRLLAAADTLGFVVLLDLATGGERARLRASDVGILTVRFSPDGRSLATAGLDRTAKVWDLDQVLNPRPSHSAACGGEPTATTPDGTSLSTPGQAILLQEPGSQAAWSPRPGAGSPSCTMGRWPGTYAETANKSVAPDGFASPCSTRSATLIAKPETPR